jgi:hypothetical protein
LQDQAARTVLEKHLPAAMGHPMFSSVGDLSLQEIARLAPHVVSELALKAIDDELAAL